MQSTPRLKGDLLECYLILPLLVLQTRHLYSVLIGTVGPTVQLHRSADVWNTLCHNTFLPNLTFNSLISTRRKIALDQHLNRHSYS